MRLSVIIPFYRVERYFGACLAGLEGLPRGETEILLVDDCGDDGSLKLASEWSRGRDNVRILRREANGGLSAARNTGLAAASGDYVFFLDSDDVPDGRAIGEAARLAAARDLDVLKARFVYYDDADGQLRPGPEIPVTGEVSGAELFAGECRADCYEPMVWQCLYRRSFLEKSGLRMTEGILFEDEVFQLSALLAAGRASACGLVLLRYRQRAGSIMASFTKGTAWCGSYLEICRLMSGRIPDAPGAAVSELKRRVGQIALGAAKNIEAYGLTGEVRGDALGFVRRNRRELSGYALRSGRAALAAQGLLLGAWPELYLGLYGMLRRALKPRDGQPA